MKLLQPAKFVFNFSAKLVSAALVLSLSGLANAAGIDDLQRGFERPPDDARIMMRWWWFGPSVAKEELEREMRVMKAGGIGGIEVQPVYPLLPDDTAKGIKNLPYLSDEFMEMLKFTAQKSKELGLRMDLTLGSGWSFGGAKVPINEASGALRVERVKIDANTKRVPLPSMIPSEKLLGVFIPLTHPNSLADVSSGKPWEELTNIKDNTLLLTTEDANKGGEVLFFISGKTGMQVKRPAVGAEGYVLNHLDKPSVESYLKNTGDRLMQAFDKDNRPYSVFSDSLEVYNQDWTDDLLNEFQKRRGYDLKPLLPALIMDMGAKSADIRYDWGRTLTELFNERFATTATEWAHRNGTKFRSQNYGIPPAAISSSAFTDISDGEGAQWKVVRAARWASSANHIYGKNITSSETWTWLHSPVFRATPLDMKAEADIHFLQGINQLIGHGWAYTPPAVEYPGWRFYAAGIYDEKNPWWIVMPDLSAYLQKMSWLMRQGEQRNDVALYLPNADAYAKFSAGRVHLIEVERELVGEKIMPGIFASGYNLDFFDDEMLRTVGKTANGNLNLGAGKYRIVILPGVERIPLESLKKLEEFVKSGGSLIATRRLPTIAPGFNTTQSEQNEAKAIIKRLFDGSSAPAKFVEDETQIGAALKSSLQPDVDLAQTTPEIGFVHRQTPDADVYFLANTTNAQKTVKTNFRVNGRTAEIWNPLTGEIRSAETGSSDKNTTSLTLNFEPYQSHVVIFSKRRKIVSPPVFSNQTAANDLSSDWKVSFGQNSPTEMSKLKSWTENESTQFFSGTAAYEKSFEVASSPNTQNSNYQLDFGEAKPLPTQVLRNGMQTFLDAPVKEAAVVYINDQRVGSVWCPPYRMDVTPFLKNGTNKLRIEVANTALNYMAGHKLPDYKLLNLRYGERFQAQDMDKIRQLESGLTGNIRLIKFE